MTSAHCGLLSTDTAHAKTKETYSKQTYIIMFNWICVKPTGMTKTWASQKVIFSRQVPFFI